MAGNGFRIQTLKQQTDRIIAKMEIADGNRIVLILLRQLDIEKMDGSHTEADSPDIAILAEDRADLSEKVTFDVFTRPKPSSPIDDNGKNRKSHQNDENDPSSCTQIRLARQFRGWIDLPYSQGV